MQDVGVHERHLKWTSVKFDMRLWIGCIWLKIGISGGIS
jgi:hypothetical protein